MSKNIYNPSQTDALRELQQRRQWVCWKKEERDGKGTKVPYQPNGSKAKTNEPETWVSYADGMAALQYGQLDGLGFVFSNNDCYTGIDLDHCIKDGQLDPKAQEIVDAFGSYTEYSPSKTGLHIIVRGKVVGKGVKKRLAEIGFPVEVYSRGRYFTFTGEPFCGYDKIEDRQAELERLCERLSPTAPVQEQTTARSAEGPMLSDAELIAKAEAAENGDKFKALFRDGWSGPSGEYPSPSEAAMALAARIAFWTPDDEQVNRIFCQSALYSGKWEKKWHKQMHNILMKVRATGDSYGQKKKANQPEDCVNTFEYKKHIAFMKSITQSIRRSVIDDGLYVQLQQNGRWESAKNVEQYIRGQARPHKELNKNGEEVAKYKLQAFLEYLEVFKHKELKPQLLIDIPQWDGVQRIREICKRLVALKFTEEQIFELVREWGCKAYLRAFDPHINQHFLLLTGRGQGMGKDTLISALVRGWDHYCESPPLVNDQNKVSRSLSELVVAFIPEFDKLGRQEMAMLKDIITNPSLFYDQKWVQGNVRRASRYSFIGSANSADILCDWTGNRRFRIIELKDITLDRNSVGFPIHKHHYPGDPCDPEMRQSQLQILAEFKHMAEKGDIEASAVTQEKMAEVIASLTPSSPEQELVEAWNDIVQHALDERQPFNLFGDSKKRKWFEDHLWISHSDAIPLLEALCKLTGKRLSEVKRAFKHQGFKKSSTYYHGGTARGFMFTLEGARTKPSASEENVISLDFIGKRKLEM